jgi:hypothetical protein
MGRPPVVCRRNRKAAIGATPVVAVLGIHDARRALVTAEKEVAKVHQAQEKAQAVVQGASGGDVGRFESKGERSACE